MALELSALSWQWQTHAAISESIWTLLFLVPNYQQMPKVLTSIHNSSKSPADTPAKKHSTLNDIGGDISLVLCFEIGQEWWGREHGETQIILSVSALFTSKSWSSADVQFSMVPLLLESCVKSKSLAQGEELMAGPNQSWGICSLGIPGVMELSWRGEDGHSRRQLWQPDLPLCSSLVLKNHCES